jgi:hypothetical protein
VASWRDIEAEEPELAALAREFLEGHKHKTLATLRRDGSPRVSGIEAEIVDGELLWGGMPGAMKSLDLRRDPRFALHSGSGDPPDWAGDAKVSGRAEEIADEDRKRALLAAQGHTGASPGPFDLFRGELEELVVVHLNEERTKLVIERWREGDGVKRFER